MMRINETAEQIHAWAHKQGFYGLVCNPPCRHQSGSVPSALMLVVTELSEAVEAHRKGDKAGLREEIADAMIRLLDFAAAERIDLEHEIDLKMAANEKRPHRHGKAY